MNSIRALHGARLPYLLPLLAAVVYVLRWSVHPDNYFFADDWMSVQRFYSDAGDRL